MIFSSIVTNEVSAHLEDAIRTLRTSLKGLNRDVERLVPQLRPVIADDDELDKLNPGDAARARLSEFMAAVEAEVVGSTWADLTDIERRYFQTLPPVAGTGNKKHEFPDAIALSAIEGWAKAKEVRVLAVSEDKGWVAFESEHIKVVPNIPTALGILQTDPEHRAHLFIASYLRNSALSKLYRYSDVVFAFLERALERVEFDVSFDSDMAADPDHPSVELKSFTFGEDFIVVKISEDELVANVSADLLTEVTVSISFSVHDSVDDDDVPMGDASIVREIALDNTELLLTFHGTLALNEWDLADVEFSVIDDTLELEYVAPNWRQEEPDIEPDPGEP